MTSSNEERAPREVREAVEELSRPRPMRRGSLSVRYVKCSKKGCPCGEDPQARHGPYYSLTRSVAGRTRSRYLSPEQAEEATRQIEAGQEFRRRVEGYWQACEDWADEQLEGASEAPQKKGSKTGSGRRSGKKSGG